ncbi:hypothetical protein TorRG33x02_253240, partial [Trema orientale]
HPHVAGQGKLEDKVLPSLQLESSITRVGEVHTVEGAMWMALLCEYLEERKLPEDKNEVEKFRYQVSRYIILEE